MLPEYRLNATRDEAAVSWASKKEPIALCIMEAEYQSAAPCAREACWLQNVWPTLGHKVEGPITVHGDNAACSTKSHQF